MVAEPFECFVDGLFYLWASVDQRLLEQQHVGWLGNAWLGKWEGAPQTFWDQCASETSAFPFVSDVPPLLCDQRKGGGGQAATNACARCSSVGHRATHKRASWGWGWEQQTHW